MRDSERDMRFERRQQQDDDDWYNGRPGPRITLDAVTPLVESASVENQTLLVTIEEAARLLGIGRTTMFELIGRGELKSVRLGRRRLIARRQLESFVEELSI